MFGLLNAKSDPYKDWVFFRGAKVLRSRGRAPSVSQSPQPPSPFVRQASGSEDLPHPVSQRTHPQFYLPCPVPPHSCWCNTPLRVLVSTSTRSSRWPMPRGAASKQVCSIGFQRQGKFPATSTLVTQASKGWRYLCQARQETVWQDHCLEPGEGHIVAAPCRLTSSKVGPPCRREERLRNFSVNTGLLSPALRRQSHRRAALCVCTVLQPPLARLPRVDARALSSPSCVQGAFGR